MSCKLIAGSETCFHLSPKPFQTTTTTKSMLSSFNTHLPKQSFSMKASSGSHRTTTRAAVNNLYATTETTESFYELLGISESVSLPEIKKAYKQLALKYHPDVSPADMTEEYTRTFIRVQEAYETLSDERRRALYDMDLSNGLHLAFSARKHGSVQRGDWSDRWESQLSELKRRSMNKDDSRETVNNNMSWGARVRRQRNGA